MTARAGAGGHRCAARSGRRLLTAAWRRRGRGGEATRRPTGAGTGECKAVRLPVTSVAALSGPLGSSKQPVLVVSSSTEGNCSGIVSVPTLVELCFRVMVEKSHGGKQALELHPSCHV